jgi:hypothetical protein
MELAKWANEVWEVALKHDEFSQARELYQSAMSLARSADDRELLREIMSKQSKVEEARREYSQIGQVIQVLDESPDDPQANLAVGRYYCFVKGEWERGLPFLAKGSDRRLAALAETDLRLPIVPIDQSDLADRWWELGEGGGALQKDAAQKRAAHWYRQAAPNLPDGLAKIKAEFRLKELKK